LLPVELAQLADPVFEDDAMRRLVEKQSFCRQFQGIERLGRGPIVVCVDESGSMACEQRIENAKAFALAMAWLARHQNRWCCLIGYSGGSAGTCCVLKPHFWNELELLNWLDHFYGGGTTMTVCMETLPYTYWPKLSPPKGKTDIVIITDGQVHINAIQAARFAEWRKEQKAHVISLIINGYADDLAQVSDVCHTVRGIDLSETAVQDCLGV
jgi:uncharacterized protein with von Willebrand factor type A (vWA) domain